MQFKEDKSCNIFTRNCWTNYFSNGAARSNLMLLVYCIGKVQTFNSISFSSGIGIGVVANRFI